MNRRPDAPDPLTAEERELADRLLRVGPHDGPSPALDARILAAAHAAVAQAPRARPRSRWPAWIGVAASLSLAVGIAWQLRPTGKSFEAVGEDPATVSAPAATAAETEAITAATPGQDSAAAADAAAVAPAAVPPPLEVADAAGAAAAPALPARTQAAAPVPAGDARRERSAEAPQAEPHQARRAPPQAFSLPEEPAPIDMPAPPPAPPAPPAPASAAPAAPSSAVSSRSSAPAAQNAAAGRDQSQDYRAAEARPAPLASETAARKATAAGAVEAKAAPAAAPAAEAAADSVALDRIEVTGSRIGAAADADDARLAPAQWLQRIREYRDAGQIERARDGLRRFRSAHPRTRIPDDLRPLLK
ncbi:MULTISPECIES: hypothetical protein [Lysobacter]|uniref:Peptidoglycan-binding protein n=1 Tax=Lysobacter firmicutimachus TaxID=1792846 RepID=A0ABU8D1Q9_9GAMM|nr:hypothetical protein [Lysobacter antibioticus]